MGADRRRIKTTVEMERAVWQQARARALHFDLTVADYLARLIQLAERDPAVLDAVRQTPDA